MKRLESVFIELDSVPAKFSNRTRQKNPSILQIQGLALDSKLSNHRNGTDNNVLLTQRYGKNSLEKQTYFMTAGSRGRLGNQMFQYAGLFALSRRNPTWIPFIRNNGDFGRLRNTFGNSLSIKVANYSMINVTLLNDRLDADRTVRELKHLPKTNLSLHGYFTSHKYFADAKNELRKEFTSTQNVQDEVLDYYKRITPISWQRKRFIRVGVHVRRSDFLTEDRRKMGFILPQPSYFANAMKYFVKKYNRVQFIVASDDLSWCKKNIVGENIEYSDHNYIMDLAITSLSDHIIISLGTYSWWAGWLCKGTTVYYGVMPRNGTYMATVYKNNSHVPVPEDQYNHWIPIV